METAEKLEAAIKTVIEETADRHGMRSPGGKLTCGRPEENHSPLVFPP